ncbi:MAG: peptidoglycan-binding protein [Oscillatoria sp. SIO1A7]|nr:peptidoglycan-binding protein [Oscillatoria sp. SIO1A7]
MDNLVYVHWYLAQETETPTVTFNIPFKPKLALAVIVTMGGLILNTADPALAALQYGNEGADVVELQNSLKEIGCFDKDVKSTGWYGRITEAAVKDLQRANGLKDDGIFGSKTNALLERSDYNSCYRETVNAVRNKDIPKMGDEGENVKKIQVQLNNWGFSVEADGFFGKETRDAVKRFQKYHGLEQDGMVGKVTSRVLWSPRSR